MIMRVIVQNDMAARSGLCVASLAAIVCIAAPSFTRGASDDKQFSIYIDSDAPGYDYKRIDPPSFSTREALRRQTACLMSHAQRDRAANDPTLVISQK
jgi:hypothetical protein